MKKITIVLPVYNVEAYLDQCIQSILAQSFPEFELLIINDGSTDSSGAIAEKQAKTDQRIRLIHQENQGLSMARNTGIEAATGNYLLFVDSDDSIHQDLLQVLYTNLQKQQADVSICDYQLVNEDEELAKHWQSPYENNTEVLEPMDAVKQIVEESRTNRIIAWGKLYKKSLFKEIRYPRGKYHEDEFVTYKVFYQAEKIVVTDARLYFYLQRKESITGNPYSLKRLEKLEGLKEAIGFFAEQGEKELAISARVRYLLNIQIAYYKVTYEMANEEKVLAALVKEYREHYQLLRKADAKRSVFQAMTLKAFHLSPKFYSGLVHLFLKSGWSID